MKKCISVRIQEDDEILVWLHKKAESLHLSLDKTIYNIIKETSERTEQEDFIGMLCVNFANEMMKLEDIVKYTIKKELAVLNETRTSCTPRVDEKVKKKKPSSSFPKQTLDYLNNICK